VSALVAQWIERLRPKESVGGSIPSQGTSIMNLEVKKYYSLVPHSSLPQLKKLRQIVLKVLPNATEVISYGIPTFKVDGKSVVGIGGWNDFVSLYPYGSELIVKFKDDLAPYKTSKGAIQFSLIDPLPEGIIKKIITEKLKGLTLS
jgi:uncharacterized protein YdhG (YjbR/CyaY superfamily)